MRDLASCPPLWRFRARCEWLRVEWQSLAREYARLGAMSGAACCQTLADHFARTCLGQMGSVWRAVIAERTLTQLRQERARDQG